MDAVTKKVDFFDNQEVSVSPSQVRSPADSLGYLHSLEASPSSPIAIPSSGRVIKIERIKGEFLEGLRGLRVNDPRGMIWDYVELYHDPKGGRIEVELQALSGWLKVRLRSADGRVQDDRFFPLKEERLN